MGGRACVYVRVSAVSVCIVLVWGLGMNGRVCSFVCASTVRMCTVPVLGLACLCTPYRAGCMARISTGLVRYISTCARTVRCSAWAVRAVYLACV